MENFPSIRILKTKEGKTTMEKTINRNVTFYVRSENYEKLLKLRNNEQIGEFSNWALKEKFDEFLKEKGEQYNILFKSSDTYCIECGKSMQLYEHNYGTQDIPVCIHCYNEVNNKKVIDNMKK